MRYISKVLPGAALVALFLCLASVTAGAAVRGNGHGNDDRRWNGTGTPPATAPAPPPAPASAPTVPPGPAKQTTPAAPVPPGQAKKTAPAATVPPGQAKKAPATPPTGIPTPVASTTPAGTAPGAIPPAVAPVLGESMGVRPVDGGVKVRLPNTTAFVALADAGSIPSGAVIDAREGTVLLRTAVAGGRTQTAKVRGAVFEVRQTRTGAGMTDIILRGGRPAGCPAGGAASARAAAVAAPAAKAKPGSAGLWASDSHGRFRTHGRTSVATVRGTRWVTRETCAGTRTTVLRGAVDVFDRHTRRTVRVRAGHSYLARSAS